ncbi:4Fe-4S single cluster domain-containing protein [Solwaraspora sp. WMMB335]|uniref:4Fe-4S single cluster domain-containing protein n=1 Tax=Solwaraspora sp. WMMB335 TaxID=3404118 RepID=UPI003B9272BB
MAEPLRLTRAHFPVTALGYGQRLGLWLQGCTLSCPGCIAKDTWDRDGGVAVGVEELLDDVRRALDAGADGLTVSGGEPLQQAAVLTRLLRGVRQISSASPFDVLLYTGYELDELDPTQRAAADLADALVTGRYVASRPTRRIWRGSANQEMVLLTPLARERYTASLDFEPAAPPIQVETSPDGRAWWVGVPNHPDTKRALDGRLAALGYTVDSVSWRRR